MFNFSDKLKTIEQDKAHVRSLLSVLFPTESFDLDNLTKSVKLLLLVNKLLEEIGLDNTKIIFVLRSIRGICDKTETDKKLQLIQLVDGQYLCFDEKIVDLESLEELPELTHLPTISIAINLTAIALRIA